MGKAADYAEKLASLDEWEPYLLAESGLPGPRGNLELMQVVADLGDESRFRRYLEFGPEQAPTNDPHEFLAVCGVVGLGRLLAEGRSDLLPEIRRYASDPRWRMREGVAMALQRFGDRDVEALLDAVESWAAGTPLEQRAAAAALCEPRLLSEEAHVRRVLALLDRITGSILDQADRRSEAFKALRKGLGYCWSVAAVALPGEGLPLMERWLACDDKDIRWIMKQNLGKKRLERLDAAWVERWKTRLKG
jgi:hypothetical protein